MGYLEGFAVTFRKFAKGFVNDDIAARRLVEERVRALSSPHHSAPLQGPSTGNGSRAEPHDL